MSIVTPPKEEWPYIEVYGGDFRGCLKDMADTVTRLELWDWFNEYRIEFEALPKEQAEAL